MGTINGTSGSEKIIGTLLADEIYGNDGDDTVDGGAGNDTIWGGTGDDSLLGGDGDDQINGGAGNDVVDGGLGVDTLSFAGARSDYSLLWTAATSSFTLSSKLDGVDRVTAVEFFKFSDSTLSTATLADTTPPTISISSPKTSLSIGQTATLTFTLSEPVSDFVLSDITVSGGALSSFLGSGARYSAVFTPASNGSTTGIVSVGNGKFSDAAGNFNVDGSDANNSFTFAVNPAGVVNSKPSSASVTLTTPEDTAAVLSTGNFAFKDLDPLDTLQTVVVTSLPSKGALKLGGAAVVSGQSILASDIAAGKLTFTPLANGNGKGYGKLVFKVSDGKDFSSFSYTLTVDVTPVNDAPTFSAASLKVSGAEDKLIKGIVKAVDVDIGDKISYSISTRGTKGSVVVNAATGAFVYTPIKDANGADSFVVTATDSKNTKASQTVNIELTPVNDPPTVAKAVTAQVNITEGTPFNYSLPSDTFQDVDDSVLTYTATGLPTWMAIDSKTGGLSGTPGYNASNSAVLAVTIKATDAGGLSASMPLSFNFNNKSGIPVPTVAKGGGVGSIAVTIGAGAISAKLYDGSTDVSGKFSVSIAGSVVTFTPNSGQVELVGKQLTARAVDSSGKESFASSPLSYSFDNVAPPPPTSITTDPLSGVVTVAFGTSSGQVPSSIKLIAGTEDITSKFSADTSSPGLVKLTPLAGGVEVAGQTLNAAVADAAGNVSGSAASQTPYTFDNAISISGADDGKTFDATAAKYRYTFAEGAYAVTIKGFAVGDELLYAGASLPALNVTNASTSDGQLVVAAKYGGSNVVTTSLVNLTVADDSKVTDLSTFKAVLGDSSLGTVTLAPVAPTAQSVSISSANAASGFNASAGNFAFAVALGDYSTTITGFSSGDTLSFFGDTTAALSVTNTSGADGIVNVTGVFNKQAVDVTLAGIPAVLDAQVIGVVSFNSAFGAGSLIP